MTILVTGATGRVGRHLIQELLNEGQRLRALTRNPASAKFPSGVEVFAGDLSDPATLVPALRGATALHLITTGAGYIPLTTGDEIIRIADKAGVKRVTVLWDGRKGTVEQAVESSELEWTQLQPVDFMSNASSWKESIQTEGVVRDLFGDSLQASVHERDVARVAAAALTKDGHAGKTYTLTGPEVLTVPQKVDILSKVIGKDIRFVQITEAEERARMAKLGVEEEIIDYVINWHKHPPVEAYTVNFTVEQVTGTPARTFSDWAREHAGYFTGEASG